LREALFSPPIDNGKIVISEEPGLGISPAALSELCNNPLFTG